MADVTHPFTGGARLLGPARTEFRFWAPAQQKVALQVEELPLIKMSRDQTGWYTAEADCGAGAAYCYVLDDGSKVPDPASRAQVSDVHGPSVVIDRAGYAWRKPDWRGRPWHECILYELHPGLYGGFEGIRDRLDEFQELGVTAIELMPINDFPGVRNWGYDGVLPFAPDRSYGTPDELKELIDAAHERGLMMFLDVVYNHFGPDGNYIAQYAPQFFRQDVQTPWGPAIDFRLPEVRAYFTANALQWLVEYKFDGLRFDAVHAITESDWLDEMAEAVRAAVEPGRHVHLVLENDDNVAEHLRRGFDAQWNDDFHHVMHVMLTGEAFGYYEDYATAPAEALARALAEGFVYQGQASQHRGGVPRGTPSGDLAPTSFVTFLQNHDQIGNRAFGERLTALAAPQALEAAIALQLLCPQIPLLFMGEEIGTKAPFLFFTDHHGELAKAVREGRRREFAKFPDFADESRREQIPDPNARSTFEASRPTPTAGSGDRFKLYQQLIGLRKKHLVPRLDGATGLEAAPIGPAAVSARWRLGDGAVLTLLSNLAASDCATNVRPKGMLIFASRAEARASIDAGVFPAHTTIALLESSGE